MIAYRGQGQPGCGGCFLVFLLLVLLFGGAPFLLQLLGFLFFSGLIFVVLAGAAFWYLLSSLQRQSRVYQESQTASHNLFVTLLVKILVKIAQADGEVTREEVATIRRFFQDSLHYDRNQLYWVRDLIKEARGADDSLEELVAEFRRHFSYEPRLILVELIYRIVFTKTTVLAEEKELARSIARFLGIFDMHQRIFEAKYASSYQYTRGGGPAGPRMDDSMEEKRCLGILGLEPGAGWPEIKKAYRALSMQYHPDKVRHLGEEFQQVAEEKMKEINNAYQFLEKRLNRG